MGADLVRAACARKVEALAKYATGAAIPAPPASPTLTPAPASPSGKPSLVLLRERGTGRLVPTLKQPPPSPVEQQLPQSHAAPVPSCHSPQLPQSHAAAWPPPLGADPAQRMLLVLQQLALATKGIRTRLRLLLMQLIREAGGTDASTLGARMHHPALFTRCLEALRAMLPSTTSAGVGTAGVAAGDADSVASRGSRQPTGGPTLPPQVQQQQQQQQAQQEAHHASAAMPAHMTLHALPPADAAAGLWGDDLGEGGSEAAEYAPAPQRARAALEARLAAQAAAPVALPQQGSPMQGVHPGQPLLPLPQPLPEGTELGSLNWGALDAEVDQVAAAAAWHGEDNGRGGGGWAGEQMLLHDGVQGTHLSAGPAPAPLLPSCWQQEEVGGGTLVGQVALANGHALAEGKGAQGMGLGGEIHDEEEDDDDLLALLVGVDG